MLAAQDSTTVRTAFRAPTLPPVRRTEATREAYAIQVHMSDELARLLPNFGVTVTKVENGYLIRFGRGWNVDVLPEEKGVSKSSRCVVTLPKWILISNPNQKAAFAYREILGGAHLRVATLDKLIQERRELREDYEFQSVV